MLKKIYLDKRILVSGKSSEINMDNPFNLHEYINSVLLDSITASNGLTKTDNVIALGGTLTGNTLIEGRDNTLQISDSSIQFTGGDAHDFNSTIAAATSTTVIQNHLFGAQLRRTDNTGIISSVSVYDVFGVTNLILTLKDSSLNAITMTLTPNGGNGFPSLEIEGLQEYVDETAATTAGLQPNMIYVTAATKALTIVGAGGGQGA